MPGVSTPEIVRLPKPRYSSAMPLSSPPDRGAYIAPYLDASGLRVVLLIDRRHRLVHRMFAATKDLPTAYYDAMVLLDLLDPPRVTETS